MKYSDINSIISTNVQEKIIQVQNKMVPNDENELLKRMESTTYIEQLFKRLNSVEQSLLRTCLSFKETDSIPESELAKKTCYALPSQLKLAILSLRQKGLLFVTSTTETERMLL